MGWLSKVNCCEWVKALSPIIAAFIAVCGVKKTIEGNEKAKRIEVVTQSRVKWMQEFKDYISRYIALCKYILDSGICKEECEKYELDMMELYNKLVMHLNFRGNPDIEILDDMKVINFYIFKMNVILKEFDGIFLTMQVKQMIRYRIELISLLTKIYLKAEWERIKIEAEGKKKEFDEIYLDIRNTNLEIKEIDEKEANETIANLYKQIQNSIKEINDTREKIGKKNKEKVK